MEIVTVFFTGILTLFSPCIFPLLPVYFMILTSSSDKNDRFIYSLLFILGFTTVFTMLGLGASSIGIVLKAYQFNILLVSGMILVLMGLYYIDYLNLSFLNRTFALTNKSISFSNLYLNSLVVGVVFAFTWTPCLTPSLGAVLSFAMTKTTHVYSGALYLFTYSLGIGLPIFVIAIFFDKLSSKFKAMGKFLPIGRKITGIIFLILAITIFQSLSKISRKRPQNIQLFEKNNVIFSLGNKNNSPALVMFHSDDCYICHELEPFYNELKKLCNNKGIFILSANLSNPKNQNAAFWHSIRGVPTFILFSSKGEEISRISGRTSNKMLLERIKEYDRDIICVK